jgi:iron complex transport system ATP-binding protein
LLQRVPTTDSVLDVVLSGLDASLGLYREFDDGEKALAGEILSLVHVGELAGQRYAWCSQGEQQRVLIARALVNRPDLLILDEPCAGLDPAARQGFLSDLRRLAARPEAPTMILVTHHIEEIGEWIEYVLMLKGGGVLACGEKEAVLTSETLSNALEHPCRVRRTEATYFVEPGPG